MWESLKNALAVAGETLTFHRPFTSKNIKGFDAGPTANARAVFDSFARCLARAIARSKAIPPGSAVLEQEFHRCRSAWESATIDYDIVAPIGGIHAAAFEGVELVHGLSLAWDSVLSENARHHLDQHADVQFRGRAPAVLAGRRTVDKGGDSESLVSQVVRDVTQCVTALRLATGRIVGCDIVHILISESHFQTFNAVANYTWSIPETAVYGDFLGMGQALTDAEAESVRHVAALLSGDAGAMLEIAVERFNLAAGRLTLEDQIIDLAISLESTICRGGGGEQLSYRFRVFGAAVLADKLKAEDAFKLLGSLYTARSKIVHAGERLASFKAKDLLGRSAPQFVVDCRELARWIVLEFLEQAARGRSPEQYVKEFERYMISSAKKALAEGRGESSDEIVGA